MTSPTGEGELSSSLPDPRSLLRRYGLRPRKALGQHFLVDRRYLGRIVSAARLRTDDVVVEIGPGLGVLTLALADRAAIVIAVEVDADMRAALADIVDDRANIEIVAADILSVDTLELVGRVSQPRVGRNEGLKVVANLPYYITSAVLKHFLESPIKPELMVVMVQREVAERIMAEPGDLSLLALGVQLYAEPSRVASVPREAFYPRPKVDSTVLCIRVRARPSVELPAGGEKQLFRVARAGFSQKRKQLRNSIAAGLAIERQACAEALEAARVDPTRRAQTLTLHEWSAVSRELAERGLL